MSSRRDSDFARIEELLKEAQEKAEQERERADGLRRRAEEEQRNRQNAEQKLRPTSFDEYIRMCHILLSKPLRVQTDRSLSTQGSITSPKNKPCPIFLKPWTEFPVLQQRRFEEVSKCIPRDAEVFNSIQFLTELGQQLCDRPLASEKDLERYQPFAVQQPVANIISHLRTIDAERRIFRLGDGIVFENHANTLSDNNVEVQQSLEKLRLSSKQPTSRSNPRPKNADQICVYKETDGTRSPCMIVEYKPPHKLSVLHLRAGLLSADNGCMDVPAEVVNRVTIPKDPEENFVYVSELLVATALTQTYGYMVENGLEYSYIVTGEAFIFLWIKENEPHTLYYHLAEPNVEAEGEAQGENGIVLCRTAVSLVLAFCMMALESIPRSQKWRHETLATCPKFVIDHEEILRQIPPEAKNSTPPPSAFRARFYPVYRSPIGLRPRKPKNVRDSCGPMDIPVQEDPQNPSDSSDETGDLDTPSKPRNRPKSHQSRISNSSQSGGGSEVRQRQYCTQACLLGVVHRQPLDECCPNVSAHRVMGDRHTLTQTSLAKRIQWQLEDDPDNNCRPLGKQGARGALFKLTLHSHGYTFVAKGTVEAFIPDLDQERQVYEYAHEVQGRLMPVYLGTISLFKPYYLDIGVRIVHMLLMSWGGDRAEVGIPSNLDLDSAVMSAHMELRGYGVEHCDLTPSNVLWNAENGSVMLVDFERSEIVKRDRILQENSLNPQVSTDGNASSSMAGTRASDIRHSDKSLTYLSAPRTYSSISSVSWTYILWLLQNTERLQWLFEGELLYWTLATVLCSGGILR